MSTDYKPKWKGYLKFHTDYIHDPGDVFSTEIYSPEQSLVEIFWSTIY